ncbi:MAG: SDR family NAD(P)-dependent oxidoreductase, partial [Anaerolineae bacterium]|nr:SDR family NAD(P)-dependent oxidoreductase [Anaerolineae bacterium]
MSGKVAAVTGGGGVLCGTMSRALGKLGVKVAVLDLFEESAKKVASEIVTQGGEAIGVKCDVLDKASVEAACEAVLAQWGHVDILINGAGGNKRQATTSADLSFFDLPVDVVQGVFNLNFVGTLLPTQVFGKVMAGQGECAQSVRAQSVRAQSVRAQSVRAQSVRAQS